MTEQTFIFKTDWPDGPWKNEPDKVQWVDEATGLDCLIVRTDHHGALCGYVGVAPNHPLFGIDYSKVDREIDVHGGLTYSDFCQDDNQDHGVCHVAEPGRPERVWWFGFDCAHHMDRTPGTERHPYMRNRPVSGTYRTIEYVRGECAKLAGQMVSPSPGVARAAQFDPSPTPPTQPAQGYGAWAAHDDQSE